ncbi:TetR/AcrR family transcriptional regulator [Bradyrhizobium prioriisuperbiae]|uniref:TetR/AcrR family transcriptional regulator n=1 Tax=Bradyrhizobium prioriisuperbiae TaxID=2854389 RepID=UPI0028F0DB7A|nr:TetR/AcrR family transcriptional regulator [Bradyrhizobium prioritasuperba]
MVGTRQFDEDALLEAALETFWQNGFVATSMIDMAEATGVQRGSLYNAYGDKERLFLLAFERYASRFLDFVGQMLSDPDPVVALTTLFKGVIANMSEGAPSRGCLTTKTALELPLAGKAIEARVKQLLEDLTALIRDALSTPATRRKLSCDPDAAAELVVTFTRGLAVMERAYRDPRHLEKMSEQFVRILVPDTKRRRRS